MSGLGDLTLPVQRSRSEQISDEIRQLITDGSLAPGERISESSLATKLGISRSPVREALQSLVRQRLLVTAPNKTMVVARFTADDIREIYDARQAIEKHAGKTLTELPDASRHEACDALQAELDRMAEAIRTGDPHTVSRADLQFHTSFVTSAGNARLTAAYEILSAEALTCINWLEDARPSGEELVQDHRDLLQLLTAGDGEALTEAIEQHLNVATDHLLDTDRFEAPSKRHATH